MGATAASRQPGKGKNVEPIVIKAFFLLLFFSPLLYSFDNDPLREEKILAVAAAATLFLSICIVRKRLLITNIKEIIIILLFSFLVIGQQFFIANGSFSFGIKYALVLSATFIPYWATQTLRLSGPELKRTTTIAIGLLFLVTVITISSSYVFGLGEVHLRDGSVARAFGWLGDSFTPVIVFLVVYYFLQQKYLFAALSVGTLLMTGGKAATLMLIAIPAVLVFSKTSLKMKVTVTVIGLASLLVLFRLAAPIFENTRDLPVFEYSFNTRLLSIYNGFDYFVGAPWTGVGINQSMKFVEVDSAGLATSLGIDSYYEVYQIHNAIVRTAAETGIPGLALLFLFFYVLVTGAYRRLRDSQNIADPDQRVIVLASSLWVISFVLFYQGTGWFEAGHPQLTWLLLFATLSSVFSRRRMARVVVGQDMRPHAHANVSFGSG
jgi:O-antigen ligase